MGRHRSTLRELGWGATNNSPNPWKQGSAKRVVRTLDYSQAEIDEPGAIEAPSGSADNELEDKLAQLQHDGTATPHRTRPTRSPQHATAAVNR